MSSFSNKLDSYSHHHSHCHHLHHDYLILSWSVAADFAVPMYLLEFYSGTFLKPKILVQTIEIFVLLSNITHLKRDLTPSLVFIKLVISIYIYHTCQNYSKFFHVFLWLATTEMFLFNLQCKTVLRNHIQKYERKINQIENDVNCVKWQMSCCLYTLKETH